MDKIKNITIFCGLDSIIIKNQIEDIIVSKFGKNYNGINLKKFDGKNFEFEDFHLFCETYSLFGGERIAVISNCDFLKDGQDSNNTKIYEKFKKYIEDIPKDITILVYYILQDQREKPSGKLKTLEKKVNVIRYEKLRGEGFENQIREIFKQKKCDIGIYELKYFSSKVSHNLDIINNEIEKIYNYASGKKITKEMIDNVVTLGTEDDIFNLVSSMSEKKIEKSIYILNELLFKGEETIGILFMITRQLMLLQSIRLFQLDKINYEVMIKELKLNKFVAKKMKDQAMSFSEKDIKNGIIACLNCEKDIKTGLVSGQLALEILITKIIRGK